MTMPKPTERKKKKLLSLPKLKKKAWSIYSTYRRRKEADFAGYVRCYTCGAEVPWKEAHLGHFKHGKLDFDPRNTRIQDAACNTYRGGKLDVYGVKLVEELGLEEVKDLERCAAQFVRYSRQELNEIIETYKELLNDK